MQKGTFEGTSILCHTGSLFVKELELVVQMFIVEFVCHEIVLSWILECI